MGIKTTNPHYNTFTFNGTDSSDYGVYVTDVNVFDAPKRVVDYISIPGRSGDFALDQKSFENISVVYSCAMEQDSEADFEDAISEFKNLLASTTGYKRLEDDIHPNEYRMGVFSEGLEVETKNKKSATFDVEFNCKPQRFLTSGETAVAVANNGTLTNPTLFDSRPQLQIWGYGNFTVNGQNLTITSQDIGLIPLSNATGANADTVLLTFNDQYANPGNSITSVDTGTAVAALYAVTTEIIVPENTVSTAGDWVINYRGTTNGTQSRLAFSLTYTGGFTYGTSATKTHTENYTINMNGGGTKTVTLTATVTYDGANNIMATQTATLPTGWSIYSRGTTIYALQIYSTQSALGSPIYFDLDIGEAYKIENNSTVSVNSAVSIPAELPTLTPGTNTFTYDNTITQFKVVPRWWKV